MLHSMGLQRVGHDWAAELNRTELDRGGIDGWMGGCMDS